MPVGAGVLGDVTLDGSRVWEEPEREIARILDYWAERSGAPPPGAAERRRIVEYIRGDLVLVPLASIQASRVAEKQARLTRQQVAILAAAGLNDRLLVSGPAGTGKSALIAHLGTDMVKRNWRVCLVVYNRALRDRLREALHSVDLDVETVDSLARRVLGGEPFGRTAASRDFKGLRQAAAHAVRQPLYDCLIVDEGQDLDATALELLDRVLAGGLEAGRWRVFLDPYQDLFDEDGAVLWRQLPHMRLSLSVNCRNTKQIAMETSLLSRRMLDVSASVDGPDVQHGWYRDQAEHDAQLVAAVAEKSSAYGVDEILIVSPSTAWIERLRAALGPAVELQDVRAARRGPLVGTARTVKGLEATAVIVEGPIDLVSPEARRFLYTACSRASVDLTVILPAHVRPAYDAGAVWLGARLAQQLRDEDCQP